MEHVIIIGTGCAGLTAGIYNGRANLNPLILAGYEPGGQITLTTEVENFPGFPQGIMGPELSGNMQKQAEKFGARIVYEAAIKMECQADGTYTITTDKNTYHTKTVIISTGASARWLRIPSESKFKGQGVHTCATCDGFFYSGKEIVVVGGGDSACEEANFLTKFATKVTMLVRKDVMRASKIMQDRVLKNPKINIIWNTQIKEILGNNSVETLILENTIDGTTTEFKTEGIFLGLGHSPNTEIFKGIIDLDDHGYIVPKNGVTTNLPGVFVAGDVADTRYRQAITAAGMGCQAAIEAEKYLENLDD